MVIGTQCRERGCLDYKVRVTRRKLGGRDVPQEIGNVGYIPHQVLMLDFEGRIEVLA